MESRALYRDSGGEMRQGDEGGEMMGCCAAPLLYKFCVLLWWCLLPRCNEARSSWRVYYLAHNAFPIRKGKKNTFFFWIALFISSLFFFNKQQIQNLFICVLFWGPKEEESTTRDVFLFVKKRASRDSVKCQQHDVICMYCSVITCAIVRPRSNEKKTDGWPTTSPPIYR